MERGAMIVAGFGFRRGAPLAALQAALEAALEAGRAGAGGAQPGALATAADKAPGLAPLAQALGLPVIALAPAALAGIATPTRSPASLAHRATGSLAEAAALAGAGPGARLLAARHISPCRRATCALALAPAERPLA